jgi:hypothetical protein
MLTLEKSHRIYLTFSGLLLEAMFMISNEDIERERKALEEKLFNKNVSKLRTLCHGSNILEYCKRHSDIVAPRMLYHIVAWHVQIAVHLCANVKDAAMQEVLF